MADFFQPLKQITNKAQSVLNDLLTDPDQGKMQYFQTVLDELKELAIVYGPLYPDLMETIRPKIARTTFAQGGDCVQRGIFCPSPVLNLVVGCNRGVEIASPEEAGGNFYKYCFDNQDNPICAVRYDYSKSTTQPEEIEFILRKQNIEFGITYNSDWREVTYISKTAFREDGQPEYYAAADYDDSEPDQMYLHYEEYHYQDNVPVRAEVYFGISPELAMYDHHTFLVTVEPSAKGTTEGPSEQQIKRIS